MSPPCREGPASEVLRRFAPAAEARAREVSTGDREPCVPARERGVEAFAPGESRERGGDFVDRREGAPSQRAFENRTPTAAVRAWCHSLPRPSEIW